MLKHLQVQNKETYYVILVKKFGNKKYDKN